ncbi:TIR domain-containing protein [Streptomyces umbrinus]|uniref:TIR domain-containing protein n=1 Tax=Streptomyces umbrinus TaxID=67370 RepID=UPI003C2D7B7F
MRRDAFISYSHRRDVPLAQALEEGLRDILRTPWLRRSRLKIFRDATSLAASHDLDSSIKTALTDCRYFIYLASPEAARSRWVREEIKYWRQNHGMELFLIALSGGSVVWDPTAGDFDWAATDALPRTELEGAFAAEPLWVDLTNFRESDRRTMKPGSEFRDRVAGLAAPLHGMAKDALDSTDLHIQRKAVRILRLFVVGLLALALVACTAGVLAWQQRGEALARARTSASQALAARSLDMISKDPRKAAQYALYAQAVRPTGESAQALAQAVAANGSVVRHLQAGNEEVEDYHGVGTVNATNVAISRDGSMMAYYSDFDPDALNSETGQLIRLYDIGTGKEMPPLFKGSWPKNGGAMTFSADGRTLAVEEPYNRIAVWDVNRRKLLRTIAAGRGEDLPEVIKGLQSFAFAGDGRRIAATFYTPGEPEGFHVAVWDTRTGRPLTEESVEPRSLTLGSDTSNRLLALDHLNGRIRSLAPGATSWSAWRTLSGFPSQDEPVVRVTFSADGSKAYVGERGEVWDLAKGRRLATGDGKSAGRAGAPGAAAEAVHADDRSVSVYDATLRRQRVLGTFTWPVSSVASSGDGRWVAAGSQDGAVSLFSTTSFREGVSLSNAPHLKPADLAPDNRTAFRAEMQGTGVWAVTDRGVRRTGRIPLSLTRKAPRTDTLVASLDGTRVVVARKSVLSLWDPRDGRRVGRPTARHGEFTPVAFLADGVHVVGTTTGVVQVLDTRSWKVLRSLPVANYAVPRLTVSLSADRATVVVVRDEELIVWRQKPDGELRQVRKVSVASVQTQFGQGVTVSADGERVAYVNGDRVISVVDVSTGKLVRGTSAATYDTVPVFGGDNALLVQAGISDGEPTLQFWDAATTESRGAWTLPDRSATITSLLSGDDGSVTAFGTDGTLVRRTVDVAHWRKVLCDLVPQELPGAEYDRYLEGLDVAAPCPA